MISRLALLIALASLPVCAQQCFYSISPNNLTASASGGNGLVTISSSPSSCTWTSASNAPWITVSFGQTGTGNGSSGFTVSRNTSAVSRTGTLTVAGQLFTVSQSAASCDFRLGSPSTTLPAEGGSGSVSVTTECSWTANTNANWLSLSPSSGTGNGTVAFNALPNTTSSSRSATIVIGSQSFTVSQSAPCTFTFTPGIGNFTATGGTGSIAITASATSCDRTALSLVPWITLSSGQSGTGNGSIAYSVAVNPSSEPRSGSIQIGEQTYTVGQFGGTCFYSLTPQLSSLAVVGGSGTFAVSSTCAWTAVSDSDWLVVQGSASGTGSGTVSWGASQNLSPSPRSGSIRVGTGVFVVSQPGQSCSLTLNPSAATISSGGGSGTISVDTTSQCSWVAVPQVPWISAAQGSSGPGSFSYAVQANTGAQRVGAIVVGSSIFTLTQTAANCTVSLGSPGASLPASGGAGSLTVQANCAWTAITSASWIQLTVPPTGNADATVSFVLTANPGAGARTGTITVGGQSFSVRQAGGVCSITVGVPSITLPPRGGAATVAVTGGPACDWSAAANEAFLNVSWASVSGSGTVNLNAGPNITGVPRMSTVSVSGQTFTVTQLPIVVRITAEGVVNAASFLGGPVAPGEIVTLYGTGFGPADVQRYQLTTDRQNLTKTLADTRVLLDGIMAPLIYVTDGQLSAIVPYAVASKLTTELVVEYFGVRSNPVTLTIGAAAPAIFTLNQSGRGPGAILNQDYSLNSASVPARVGSVVQIFATGEGSTRPTGTDGKLAAAPLPVPTLPVTVRIGGIEARVQYAGAAPGLVGGLVQINAFIPAGIAPGPAVPIMIRVGTGDSPSGVTLAVSQ